MDFNRNYFELFGLPVDYRVTQAQLAERYREVQKEVHPDRYAASSEAERRAAMQMATLVNTANLTLKDPLKRAIYMLELAEVSIQDNPQLPPALLMEQIEQRDELEAIDHLADEPGLQAFCEQLRQRMAALEDRFANAMASNITEAETLVYELQFLTKLMQEANSVEERFLNH